MPWKERCVVETRMEFVVRLVQGERMSDLCREYEISRKTGYKIYERYRQIGLVGLEDQSRAPKVHPNETPAEIRELIVEAKKKRPTWGSKKLREGLLLRHPGVSMPARCTIDEILKRAGLVTPRRVRRRVPVYPETLSQSKAPNDIWCADFKGQFRLGNGNLCYPLTITDHYSRYLICCTALESTNGAEVFVAFDDAFSRYGLPRFIRTDNGTPFASLGLGALTKLSAWWVGLGIVPERIEAGHPEQNGRHERMHRTLKAEATRPPARNLLVQQERFDVFLQEFNEDRPHEALAMKRPTEVFCPSHISYPRPSASLNYPLHDHACRVSPSGMIKWPQLLPRNGIYLTTALAGHKVGLRELEDGRWLVTFAYSDLGHITPTGTAFEPTSPIQFTPPVMDVATTQTDQGVRRDGVSNETSSI